MVENPALLENEVLARINYDPRARSALIALVCGFTAVTVRSLAEPSSVSHLLFMPFFASAREAFTNDNDIISDINVGLVGSAAWESLQMLFPALGQAQIEDLAFSAAGASLLFLMDMLDPLAKRLHDSKITDPIYSLLRINKRR